MLFRSQRIRLATQIGSGLQGVLYVLDEPSIGLHQRDNDRLIATLKRLRDLGNTVLVVEHDEDTIRQSDMLIDMGPGAGSHGGEVIAIGTPDEVYSNPASPFVYQFLGNVNVFHSRLHGQWADVGYELGNDPAGEKTTGDAVAFVRPHDIEIEPTPVMGGFEALVQNVHAIGPLVRVELAHESDLVEVELTRERASTLVLGKGQRVWLKPRQVKVFNAGALALEDGGSGI